MSASNGKGAAPDRIQINIRLTEHENDYIREAAASLDMTITEYIVQKAVYEAEAGVAAGLPTGANGRDYRDMRELLGELKAQGRNLNMIAKSAATISLDTRSLSSKRLAESLDRLVAELRPSIFNAVGSACELLGAMRPRRRAR